MVAFLIIIGVCSGLFLLINLAWTIKKKIDEKEFKQLNIEILSSLGLNRWEYEDSDDILYVKSSKAVDSYDITNYFKEDRNRVQNAIYILKDKEEYKNILEDFLLGNEFKNHRMYSKIENRIKNDLLNLDSYKVSIRYRSPAGNSTNHKRINVSMSQLQHYQDCPELLMSKAEYNKYVKEQNKELLENKTHSYYERVNELIDLANDYRDRLIIAGDQDKLDKLISSLFDKTVNSIKKIKTIDSEEWDLIEKIINNIGQDIDDIIDRNQQILDYYDSSDFQQIKDTCNSLMETQKEFNEYINEKAQSISTLFGARIVRNETEIDDEYNYIRPYKKNITPFTAEVSANVFASAENNPMDYIVKYFYPNKANYPEQIQKLQLLVEELETLKDAKQIIDNYKKDYQQYLTNVPSFIMENDEDGFYSRLGFANISENILTVEYKFSYTSNGGMAQRSFVVPMTEETIIQLIETLQSKLSMTSFAKEQRSLMTSKLRQHIKERDDYTCKYCGNSTYKEPNLLLEVDHIIPVAKGGCTVEDNLQTLCWKCNRSKSSKLV